MHSRKPPVTDDEQTLTQASEMPRKVSGSAPCHVVLLEEPRCKVLEIASPGLPLVICPRRFVEHMLNLRFVEGGMQPLKTRAHSFGFHGADTEPEQVHLLRECGRISKYPV